jgi:branched-chain amino acid transport system permease protein
MTDDTTPVTDGGTSTDPDAPDSDPTGGFLARVWDNDVTKIIAVFAVLYAVYLLMGTALGYSLRGQLNSLQSLTYLIAVYAMLALALNLHWGYTGLFNIGVAGFMAVGVYVTAIVSKPAATGQGAAQVSGLGLPLPIGIAAGVLAAVILGLVAALPALRLRADYLAITTIALSEIVRFTVKSSTFQTVSVFGADVGTGGGRGLILNYGNPMELIFASGVFEALVAAMNPLVEGDLRPVLEGLTYASLLLFVFVVAYYWLLKRTGESPFGRVLKAIREDETAAQALGKNTARFKIVSFMIGCGLMGLAGILYIHPSQAVTPSAFRPQLTFFVWVALIIGGAGSNTGSVVGAAVFMGVLFQGPIYLKNIIRDNVNLNDVDPATIADAVGPLFSGDPLPLVAYTIGQINALQLVIMGVVLVFVLQNRPEGLMGHRKEEAASVSLSRRPEKRGDANRFAADGGHATDDGGENE